MENSMEVPRKTENRVTIWCSIVLLGIYPKKKKAVIWEHMCTPASLAAFTIAKIWKQPKCPSTDEWIKMWRVYTHTHTMKYYSTVKKNEILSFATMWMDLKGIIVSEVSQTEKDKDSCSHWNTKYKNEAKSEHNKTETNVENKLVFSSSERGREGQDKGRGLKYTN